jgi:NAD(P)-dependent dehydrogenase (short-subunit alcohol dehydrogenase family)
MATVLVVGSHPGVTRYVAQSLRALGWTAVSALGAEAGLRALAEMQEVDAMVVGGPEALAARDKLEERLRAREPYAPVIVPSSPDEVGRELEEAFGTEVH